MPQRAAASAAKFPSTRWTAILSLKNDSGTAIRERAIRDMCQTYWFPLYAFARHRGLQRADAEDAVQSFFLAVGNADFFEKAEQDKGKLRSFILTAFTRQLISQRLHDHAQKRGGGQPHISIDADQAEVWLLADPISANSDSTLAFERHWARNIMYTVINRLREEAVSEKQSSRFEILSRFLSPDTCMGYTVRKAAADLGLPLSTCEKSIQRLRQQFRQAVREEVASTLNNPDEESVMEEMIQLQKSLLAN